MRDAHLETILRYVRPGTYRDCNAWFFSNTSPECLLFLFGGVADFPDALRRVAQVVEIAAH